MRFGRRRGRDERPADRSARAVETSACGAPNASMYFAPDGHVRACCVNTTYPLGRIGPQTIREIWDGARISALRRALDGHDYSLGCRDCEHRVAAGDRAWSTAEQYDPYLGAAAGEFPRRMDFILSITCNLQCAMCDGELSSSIRLHREKRPPMPPAYGDDFFEELQEFLPHLERSVFLGGEPFVAREPQRVFELMIDQGHTGAVQVVTNGTQWNRHVERYLRELSMSITVSIDGYTAETLEPLRVGVDRDQLFENVDRYQETLARTGGTLSFHYCLMRQNWHEFGRFLLEADRRQALTLVMTVTGPEGFSLWNLPEAEIRAVLAELEREDQRIADRLGLNRPVWDAELARVRRHVAAIESGHLPDWVASSWEPSPTAAVPVADPVRREGGEVGESEEVDLLEEELVRWAQRPPVVLDVLDGVIDDVASPTWADSLSPNRWIGLPVADLADHLSEVMGPAGRSEVEPVNASVSTSRTTFTAGGVPVEFRSVARPGATSGRLRIVLATDGDLPAAG